MGFPPQSGSQSNAPNPFRSPIRSRRINWAPLVGYDVFISYHRKEAYPFASALWKGLTNRGFHCFFDQEDAPAGLPLRDHLRDALKRSRVLIVIVTPGALTSPYVTDELMEFQARGNRSIIPIDVDGHFLNSLPISDPWTSLRARDPIRIPVTAAAISSGLAGFLLLDQIEHHFRFRKARTRLRAVALALAGILFSLGTFALLKNNEVGHEVAKTIAESDPAEPAAD